MIASSSVLDPRMAPTILFSNSLSTLEPPTRGSFFWQPQKCSIRGECWSASRALTWVAVCGTVSECIDAFLKAEVECDSCESKQEQCDCLLR